MEPVRLVIWDLDGVFWRGTLTEEGARPRPEVVQIVIELARRGIMNAVCSKNDFATAEAELRAQGAWDYLVFPSIDWTPKGPRIAALVEAVQLRPETILFIDDLPANLAEAQHFMPGLQVAGPELIPFLLTHPLFTGKPDPELARLAQYKLLQQRQQAAVQAGGDNLVFLRASNIELRIEYDVEAHIDRAIELINRTNQLNFTKNRLPEDQEAARGALRALITKFDMLSGLVSLQDRYGDYGFIGFFCIEGRGVTGVLKHFCFSCRVLNLGVEHFIYRKLNRPRLTLAAGTTENLAAGPATIDWICLASGAALLAPAPEAKILDRLVLRGGCDLNAMSHYLQPLAQEFYCEFNTARDSRQFRIDTVMFLDTIFNSPPPETQAALESIGYIAKDWTSAVALPVVPGAKTVWVLSFWTDAFLYLNKHKQLDLTMPFLLEDSDPQALADVNFLAPEKIAAHLTHDHHRAAYAALKQNFWGVGPAFEDVVRPALETLAAAAEGKAYVIIVLAPESWRYERGSALMPRPQEAQLNNWMRATLGAYANIGLVNFGDFVPEDATYGSLFHYDRLVYARAAEHIIGLIKTRFPA